MTSTVFQTFLVRKLGEDLQVVDAVVVGEAAVAQSMQEPGLCHQRIWDLETWMILDVDTIYINLQMDMFNRKIICKWIYHL